jgi:hypothetical protein
MDELGSKWRQRQIIENVEHWWKSEEYSEYLPPY